MVVIAVLGAVYLFWLFLLSLAIIIAFPLEKRFPHAKKTVIAVLYGLMALGGAAVGITAYSVYKKTSKTVGKLYQKIESEGYRKAVAELKECLKSVSSESLTSECYKKALQYCHTADESFRLLARPVCLKAAEEAKEGLPPSRVFVDSGFLCSVLRNDFLTEKFCETRLWKTFERMEKPSFEGEP